MRDTRYESGSALILAVVLTSLLAIIGVLFLMASRVNKIAASSISQTRELDLAVDAVVAQIAEELAVDVPRVDANVVLQEYYDYPDEENQWLASLELYEYPPGSGTYRWWHLSDVYANIAELRIRDVAPEIIPEYQHPDDVWDSSGGQYSCDADADGDGVSDSLWIELPDIRSSKGWPIYAAIRVIDNGAMLNVNTAYKFDDQEGLQRIDGSSLMQIDLMALASQPGEPLPTLDHESDLLEARANYPPAGVDPTDSAALAAYLDAYEENVVWRYGEPNGPYTPFDISDELELRYRFLVNQDDIDSRLEMLGFADNRSWGFRTIRNFRRPVDPEELDEWFISVYAGAGLDPNYAYRHIATIYNMDRIIAPDGQPMVNVNMVGQGRAGLLYEVIRAGLIDAGVPDPNSRAAQMAINIVDYRDYNSDVNTIVVDGDTYYGFERPCVYISELVYYEPPGLRRGSYAIELYKPYFEDNDPCGWELVIIDANLLPTRRTISIDWPPLAQFHVIEWEDPNALFPGSGVGSDPNAPSPPHGARWVDPNAVLSWPVVAAAASYDVYFGTSYWDVNNADNSWSVGSTVYKGKQGPNTYDPNGLEETATYFWRIDPLDASDTVITTGDMWMFRTKGGGVGEPNAQWDPSWSVGDEVFQGGSRIELRRFVPDTGQYITVDSRVVPDWLVGPGELRSFQRDITRHQCVRHLWDDPVVPSIPTSFETRWSHNIFEHPDANLIQAHPYLDPGVYANKGFKNIGEIGKVFAVDAYGIGPADLEDDLRINLVRADYQQIFNYLTVFDPVTDYIDNDGDGRGIDENGDGVLDATEVDANELKIPGRININTAPWYVIAQLPWMTPEIAQAIAYYRRTWQGPFRSVGELNNLADMYIYASDYAGEQLEYPDLTPADGAADDLEERDLLFARISNLVTVRSDVFTAYILVRIGPDGPQKRVMAILDRSDVYPDGSGGVTGRVRVRALHPVPDPR